MCGLYSFKMQCMNGVYQIERIYNSRYIHKCSDLFMACHPQIIYGSKERDMRSYCAGATLDSSLSSN